MFIKEILKYDYNYAEYVVSDNKNELICMCLSVPLPNGQPPMLNMKVKMIYAFSIRDIEIKLIESDHDKNIKIIHDDYFAYTLTAKVLDANKSLVCLDEIIISLENDFPEGFPKNISNSDYIQFHVDRLDCELN